MGDLIAIIKVVFCLFSFVVFLKIGLAYQFGCILSFFGIFFIFFYLFLSFLSFSILFYLFLSFVSVSMFELKVVKSCQKLSKVVKVGIFGKWMPKDDKCKDKLAKRW